MHVSDIFWPLNPTTIYYLLIYIVVVLIRFIKIKEQVNTGQLNKLNYLFVGLEFTYTSLGMVVLLVSRLQDWVGVILAAYIVLVLFSGMLEFKGNAFTEKTKAIINGAIILVVIVVSFIGNQTVLFENRPDKTVTEQAPQANPQKGYLVAIPYVDYTLVTHLGSSFGTWRLVYVTKVEASSRDDAVVEAEAKFWDPSNKQVATYDSRKIKGRDNMFIDSQNIVAEIRD